MKYGYMLLVVIIGISVMISSSSLAMSPLDNSDATQDPDNDGLTNLEEFNAGSDPGNPDTDNDGMPDGWEWDFGLDPTDATDAGDDEDYSRGEEYASFIYVKGPHYTNYDEYYRYFDEDENGTSLFIHTNPKNADSDGDGILDPDDDHPLGHFVDPHSDPNDYDDPYINDDGSTGGASIGHDWDLEKDDDFDGATNSMEEQMGTDPNNPDTDGDKLTDGEEIRFGTDPNDWDTDNDLLGDGSERYPDWDSTDAHLVDSDNDGF